MKCPACAEEALVMTDRLSIVIESCPRCLGIWLDGGELDKIIEHALIVRAPEPTSPQALAIRPHDGPIHQHDIYPTAYDFGDYSGSRFTGLSGNPLGEKQRWKSWWRRWLD